MIGSMAPGTPVEHDPVDWLDMQLQQYHPVGESSLTFYRWSQGKRVSELLPKLELRISDDWRATYASDKDFIAAFNRRLASKRTVFGEARVVLDTPNARTLADAVRFRHV